MTRMLTRTDSEGHDKTIRQVHGAGEAKDGARTQIRQLSAYIHTHDPGRCGPARHEKKSHPWVICACACNVGMPVGITRTGSAREIMSILIPDRLKPSEFVYGSCRTNCSSHECICTCMCLKGSVEQPKPRKRNFQTMSTCPHKTGAGALMNAGVRSTYFGTNPRFTSSAIPRCTSLCVRRGGAALAPRLG